MYCILIGQEEGNCSITLIALHCIAMIFPVIFKAAEITPTKQ